MKKLLTVCLVICMAVVSAAYAQQPDTVSVTVSIVNGAPVLAAVEVTVTDMDHDGKLTINDALLCAHEQYYDGGAANGYRSENTEWGISLTCLWGIENGGAYGYYLNNKSPLSLADELRDGDYVCAYLYTDLMGYSDVYCYFDVPSFEATAGEPITLTLMSVGFDENWTPVTAPVAGATLFVDEVAVNTMTDENGMITLTINAPGVHTVTADSDNFVMVSACASVTVK